MNDDLITEETKEPDVPDHTKPFFNSNVFGDDYEVEVEEIEEIAAPPPVFSEEELEAAKQIAFDKGKSEGVRETTDSREQYVAALLSDLTQDSRILIDAEDAREKRFEEEAVRLSLQIFEQLFPHSYKEKGFEEMKKALLDVIQSEEGTSQILIEVHPDYVDDINKFIKDCAGELPRDCCYEVSGIATFSESQFKLSWKDGGAVHDINSLASRIRDILHDTIADATTNDQKPPEAAVDTAEEQTEESSAENIEVIPSDESPDEIPNDEESGDR